MSGSAHSISGKNMVRAPADLTFHFFFAHEEAAKIIRKPSSEIELALGYVAEPELIHRDNLVIL